MQIITSRVGGGHLSVAQALADAFRGPSPTPVDVWVDDLYVNLARFPASKFPSAYALMTRRFPRLWRAVFERTNRPPGPKRLELLADPVGGPAAQALIERRRPHVVVSVLPGVNGFLARAIARAGLPTRLEVVITDWADVHLGWVSAGVDHFCVPTEAAARTCRVVGVTEWAIDVVGYPVRLPFTLATSRAEARQRLGLKPRGFLILTMAGTEGSARAVAHIESLLETRLDAEIAVLCGRNAGLKRRVEGLRASDPVRVLNFVEDTWDWMAAADLLITKPGGSTLAEAFARALPAILIDPLPGQEEGNVRYTVSRGAAELATSPSHLATLARELRWAEPRRRLIAQRAAALSRPDAANRAALGILRRAAEVELSAEAAAE
ncbi:MAG: glycosyltransferase [Chloroflexota bacterium]